MRKREVYRYYRRDESMRDADPGYDNRCLETRLFICVFRRVRCARCCAWEIDEEQK